MSEKKERYLPYDRAIGDFLGIVHCLFLITDLKGYKTWMNEFHNIEVRKNYLSGYILLFNTLFRMLVSEIERNISLGLNSDDVFDRASFRGIPISKLPNTCEKTNVINLHFPYQTGDTGRH